MSRFMFAIYVNPDQMDQMAQLKLKALELGLDFDSDLEACPDEEDKGDDL